LARGFANAALGASAVVCIASLPVLSAAGPARQVPLIAVDVGHSLTRPGATSARGEPEFSFNRSLALELDRVLRERRFRTRLIGEQGTMEKLTDRTAAAAAAGADFFLSVHHDSVQPQYLENWRVGGHERPFSDRFSGFSLFVSRANPEPERSLACARAMGAELRERGFRPSLHHAEAIPGENRPLADADNGVYWFDGLAVLRTADVPAVLLEAGIIVNRADESALSQPQTRARIAGAVADGLQSCIK
jgi:N-acetylmuramoyl-L-alanine amidase